MDINYQPVSHTAGSEVDIDSWEELHIDGPAGVAHPVARDSGGSDSSTGSPERPRSRSDPSALMMSSFLSGSSAVFDLDVEQLQVKIRGVLLENTRLRDSIRESSASLRQQCEALLAWRDECQRLREERRQVAVHCQRARDVITQLREENADLREQLAQQQPADASAREPQQAEPPQDLSRRGESPGAVARR